MKKSSIIKYLFLLNVLLLGVFSLYARLVEKRSFMSWAIEQMFWISETKDYLKEKSIEVLNATLKRSQRKSDIPCENPKKYVGQSVLEKKVDGMQVFVWNDKQDRNQKVIFYLYGGAYVNQPTSFHFSMVAYMAKKLKAKVVFPIYHKTPKYNYADNLPKLEKIYREVLEQTASSKNVSFIGDSSGGGLTLSFAMYVRDQDLDQPKDIVLLSPWLDVNTDHPDIVHFEDEDPMLSAWGLKQRGYAWAGKNEADMKNPYVSPLFGDLKGLGKISIFVGTREIFLPDIEKLHQRLNEEKISHHYILEDKMNHAYVVYPIPEARKAQARIVSIIQEN